MDYNNLLNVSDKEMEKNMVLLIEDEDQELSGGTAIEAISAISAVTALFQITTACTTRCYRP